MDQTLQAVLAATASFFVVSLILASILIICKGDSKRRRNRPSIAPARARNSASPKPDFGESATFDPSLNRVSMKELVEVTRNFSPDLIIGDGSFGLVYKARLNSGPIVAVKKLSHDAFQGLREFRAEMETLGKIQHPNIVKILGYCATGSDRVLIYEFIEKGCLDQWLYDTSSEEDYDSMELRLPLSWQTRMNIVRGIARGLAFMHNLDTPIIHRDIKASNILLDENFQAHIADFGLARRIEGSHSHVSTQVAGTMGYMPRNIFRAPQWRPLWAACIALGLMEWIYKMIGEKRYMEMVDASISKDDLNESVVVEIFKIGVKCADEKWKARPTMKEVVEHLDEILA
ncbi:hypothetical protein DH2020_007355 [Rehmannia glutinosa]|uniref:Protein kinase domain-containing protein n=1 Tax=Rehmannia glutinosa TaxID=99300 RepID=A0ABR0TXY5_REHGL